MVICTPASRMDEVKVRGAMAAAAPTSIRCTARTVSVADGQ
jgi:hypothetical protein